MRVAVVGLGVEGKKASKSLLENGFNVYATDLETNIDLEDLKIPMKEANFFTDNEKITITSKNLIVDLGYNDTEIIASCDAVAVSPSLWDTEIARISLEKGKIISDILSKHKDAFTIGITGTNGKTTSSLMLKEILENAGKKVLIGGNAGGGFDGYCDIILKAEKEDYDVIIVEVCDMTLSFCDYCFDFDLIGITNIGNDHMNVHGSIENYKNSVLEFSKDKTIFLDENLSFLEEFKNSEDIANILNFSESPYNLKLFGKFNKLNAGLASSIANYLKIDNEIIKNTLENFEAIDGRLKIFKLNDLKVFIGKTDNSDAIKSLLDEQEFYAIFVGTPRSNERHRLDIIDTVANYNPEVIVLFPGLDDTIDHGLYRLKSLGYEGRIELVNNLDEIINLLAEYSHEEAILIGGNGQKTITEIQERLDLLSDYCS